jgi:hypothetical protein
MGRAIRRPCVSRDDIDEAARIEPARPRMRPTRDDFCACEAHAGISRFEQAFAMSSLLIPLFFAALGFCSLWSLMNALGSGTMTTRNSTVNVKDSPGAFYQICFCRAALICFAVAVILNAFGVIGDPFTWAHTYLPFLMPK